ncbi:MAG: glycosyltransferase family 4 protein [Chitinophagaceae bacterium]
MLPLIAIGRLIAGFRPLNQQYRIFYFFSFYHIGGAEKVHAQITRSTGGPDCIIYFTRRSDNNLLKQMFIDSGCRIEDISRFTDNKWLYPVNIIFRGIITGYINKQTARPLVFNGQNNFGYKISPWINKSVPQVELIHSLNTFSYIRIPFLPFISKTVMISQKRIDDHLQLYRKKQIPPSFDQRIIYISNAIELPQSDREKNFHPLVVLYAGRGGLEKRLHLIAEIARRVVKVNPLIKFEFMGDVSQVLNSSELPFARFYGNLSDPDQIDSVYQRSGVLLMTSETEGFPMVVIEAMVRGNVIVSTAVGDIPRHIREENGFLFTDTNNEEQIISEAVSYILRLASDAAMFNRISSANITYARNNFDLGRFNRSYRELFATLNDRP